MKKLLSTILVAVAFAAVSTVDAKQMIRKSMSESASNLADVSEAALRGQASPDELSATLKDAPQTATEEETVTLMAEIDDLKNKKAAIQKQMGEQKWFGFFRNSAAEKKAINDLRADLADINVQLAKAESKLRLNRKEVSRSWYDVASTAVKTAVAIGIPLAIIADLYRGEGSMLKAGYKKTGQMISDTGTAMRTRYNTMRGTTVQPMVERPIVETPVAPKRRFMQPQRERLQYRSSGYAD